MKHTPHRTPYAKPEVTAFNAAVERGFAVTSSSIEGIGESDFGSDPADFWQ